jgi:hypothetical protein
MKDRLDLAGLVGEEPVERFLRDEGGKLALGEVASFLVAAEPVADDDLAAAALLEPGDQVRADEAGAAGDDDHRMGAAVILPFGPAVNHCSPAL